MANFLLFESASGFALFERLQSDEIGEQLEAVQEAAQDLSRFSKLVKLVNFVPFASAEQALENCNLVSEGVVSDLLRSFLETQMPKSKKGKVTLGVSDEKLAASIQEKLPSISCSKNQTIAELLRGIRQHFIKFVKGLKDGALETAQLGLGHSYSRGKVKFNVNRVDNMIIQSSSLIETLDKDINTFAMRVREWYSYHFPELVKIVPDNITYARAAKFLGDKSKIDESTHLEGLEEIVGDSVKAREVFEAARSSMGFDIADIDMINIELFATRVIELASYRQKLHSYLEKKMHDVAPNLSALMGEQLGARLISHAGSLTSLAKYPASTIQILGAEKALFRALKTKGNTPKYGIIYNSPFIGKAAAKNKGRISRYLANKASMASRIDCFSDVATTKFGEVLRDQVEERLQFYETGVAPRKNIDVMHGVLADLADADDGAATSSTASTSSAVAGKKRDAAAADGKKKKVRVDDDMDVDAAKEDKKSSKKSSSKKDDKKSSKKSSKDEKKSSKKSSKKKKSADSDDSDDE